MCLLFLSFPPWVDELEMERWLCVKRLVTRFVLIHRAACSRAAFPGLVGWTPDSRSSLWSAAKVLTANEVSFTTPFCTPYSLLLLYFIFHLLSFTHPPLFVSPLSFSLFSCPELPRSCLYPFPSLISIRNHFASHSSFLLTTSPLSLSPLLCALNSNL